MLPNIMPSFTPIKYKGFSQSTRFTQRNLITNLYEKAPVDVRRAAVKKESQWGKAKTKKKAERCW